MTLFIALAGFIFALLGLVMMLVNPPRMSNTPEDEWNRAAHNLRSEWDAWKMNRLENDKHLMGAINREMAIMKDQLAKHIQTAHLEDEPPIDRDYRGTIAE